MKHGPGTTRGFLHAKKEKHIVLAQSAIANIFKRNTTPSVSTLESICGGFGISLAQFFAEGDMVQLTMEQKQMFDNWSSLTKPQKDVLEQLIAVMKSQ